MRFLLRNAIFILFPLVVVATVFLARFGFGTALRFGQWGEQSIADSTLLITREKIERVEHVISTTDDIFLPIFHPAVFSESCVRWRRAISLSPLIEAAAIVDEYGDIAAFFHRDGGSDRSRALERTVLNELVPRLETLESYEQYKHLHYLFSGEDRDRLVTYKTVYFEDREYTSCILYDTAAIVDNLLAVHLADVGKDRIANVVDDDNEIMFGNNIDWAGGYIVARRFPSTLYKWRLQVAPKSAAYFESQAKAQRYSEAMLTPFAVGVLVFGLIVLYLAMVRERRVNRLQSEFIANVSHELKTPLSLIRMFGEILAMGKVVDPSRLHRYHHIILRETDRLTALVDNILNLARIQQGRGVYEFKTHAICDILERVREVYAERFAEQDVRFECICDDDLPEVIADEHAIMLAMGNLIDNAAKYATGTDVVGIAARRASTHIVIEVYDHGAGIPPSHLKRIFERFYRVPGPETMKQRGSGIGLSLVKHIVQAHGGSISVSSIPRTETRFSIRLPIGGEPSGRRSAF